MNMRDHAIPRRSLMGGAAELLAATKLRGAGNASRSAPMSSSPILPRFTQPAVKRAIESRTIRTC